MKVLCFAMTASYQDAENPTAGWSVRRHGLQPRVAVRTRSQGLDNDPLALLEEMATPLKQAGKLREEMLATRVLDEKIELRGSPSRLAEVQGSGCKTLSLENSSRGC